MVLSRKKIKQTKNHRDETEKKGRGSEAGCDIQGNTGGRRERGDEKEREE